MPPVDLTLIEEMNGPRAVLDYINSFDFKPHDQIIIDGETYTVDQIRREHAGHQHAKRHKKDYDVSW